VAHERLVRICFVDYDRVMAVQIARDEKLSSFSAEMLRDNLTSQRIFSKKIGFRLRPVADSSSISAVLDL
jgi:hypothetical protein